MPNIQLETGNTVYFPSEYYYSIPDEKMHEFFQACMADNLGVYIDSPFSNLRDEKTIEEEEPNLDEGSAI